MRQEIQIGYFNQSVFTVHALYLIFGTVFR
jgi:hypothetical protein